MRKYIQDIKEKTKGMSKRDCLKYVVTYYWYHIFIIIGAIALILFLLIRFFSKDNPAFTCVRVNQVWDDKLDDKLAEDFSKKSKLNQDEIAIDSDYNFSYGDVLLDGVNESSYDKFFLRWHNRELDAIIFPESCYEYCKEMGGTYRNLDEMEVGNLPLYEDDGIHTAVKIEETGWGQYLEKITEEELLLVFPTEGKHLEECQKFLSYLDNIEKN